MMSIWFNPVRAIVSAFDRIDTLFLALASSIDHGGSRNCLVRRSAIILILRTSASNLSANWWRLPGLDKCSARSNALQLNNKACFSLMYWVTCLILLECKILEEYVDSICVADPNSNSVFRSM